MSAAVLWLPPTLSPENPSPFSTPIPIEFSVTQAAMSIVAHVRLRYDQT
ncbi:MAG: hypothetical protein AAGJ31_13680 [Verrucomicrobiota bacterium]